MVTGPTARGKCEGEFEALKAINAACPNLAPKAQTWGRVDESDSDTYFLLEDFVSLQKQVGTTAILQLILLCLIASR